MSCVIAVKSLLMLSYYFQHRSNSSGLVDETITCNKVRDVSRVARLAGLRPLSLLNAWALRTLQYRWLGEIYLKSKHYCITLLLSNQ